MLSSTEDPSCLYSPWMCVGYQVTTKLSAKLKEPSPCSLDQARADTTVPYRLGLLLAFDPPLSKVWRGLGHRGPTAHDPIHADPAR